MRLDQVLHNLFVEKQGTLTIHNIGDHFDFGDGDEAAVTVTFERDGKLAHQDIPIRSMAEPGFLGLVVAEMNLSLAFSKDRHV